MIRCALRRRERAIIAVVCGPARIEILGSVYRKALKSPNLSRIYPDTENQR